MRNMFVRCLATLLFAFAWAGHAGAAGQTTPPEEFQRFAFTQPMLEKYMAAGQELKKLPKPKERKESKDDPSVDEIARELDTTPGVKPILAKYGFTSRNYALATLAMFNAGFYLAMEPSMDKKGSKELFASYPKELQANIELLRKNPQFMKQER